MTPTARRRALVAALACVLGGASCSSSTAADPEELYGTWSWVSAEGGIAGTVRTPASEGYTMALRFLRSGEVELLRDGEVQARTGFQVVRGGGDPVRGTPDRIRYDDPLLGWEEQDFALEEPDRLRLVDGCCDGFVYVFVREAS